LTQYARPDADLDAGSWNTAPLYANIDEVTADDGDYISSPTTIAPDDCRIRMSDVIDPVSASDHVFSYRYKKSGGGGDDKDLAVYLKCGGTNIANWLHEGINSSWSTQNQTLTADQANAITDYTDLRVWFEIAGTYSGVPGDARGAYVSWCQLAVPDAAEPSPELSTRSNRDFYGWDVNTAATGRRLANMLNKDNRI